MLGGKGVGSDKKPRLAQRLVELSGGQITGTEKKIVAPFSTAVGDIHERHPRTRRKIECRHARTIYVDGEVHEWRAIGFFVCGDAQARDAILRKPLVAQPVELAFSGNANQLSIEFGKIERALKRLAEAVLKPAVGVGIGAREYMSHFFSCCR